MKYYNAQAIEFKDKMLKNLGKHFTEKAEEIASQDKRNCVSKEDMARAALRICIGYDREVSVKNLMENGRL